MVTVGALVDRVRQDFLEPADEMWPRTVLTSPVNDTTDTLPIDTGLLTAEELHLLGVGLLAEVGSEQVLVKSLSGSNVTVVRGFRGTTKTSHDEGVEVLLAPPWTRKAMFDAVRDAIVGLHPPLYTVKTETVSVGVSGITQIPEDAITPVSVRSLSNFVSWTFEDLGTFPDQDSNNVRTIRVLSVAPGQEGFLTYRARFGYAASENVTLESVGLRDEWADIPCIKAAATLMAGRALSSAQMNYITGQLQAEAYPVETPGRIRDSLLRLYVFRRDEAANDLARTHSDEVQLGVVV